MSSRTKILSSEIWKTTFAFEDIYNEADDEFKKYVDTLSETDLQEFIDENLHSWRKGFESGIMQSWDIVACTIASNTSLSSSED